MTKVLQLCCSEATRLVLTSLFCFLFGFGEVEDLMLDFGFLSNLPAFATWSGKKVDELCYLLLTELRDDP